MTVVFVNYRVREQGGYATLLHRELSREFGSGQVFLASRSITPGGDFVEEIFGTLRRCEILLAVMGPRWLDFHGAPDDDWVYREIAEAFARGIRVIPVLVDDAELPAAADLPSGITALARCQYMRLRHYSIESDLDRLVREMRRMAPVLDPHGPFITAPTLYQPAGSACRIGVRPGTIRRVRDVDIWVNSENTDLRMARHTEFNISAIIRYWGSVRDETGAVVEDLVADDLEAKVGDRRPVAPGTVITTTAGMLTASHNVRHILHVAAVQGEPGAGFRQVRDIGWCVTNALLHAEQLAATSGANTVLFPLLGTGVAGAAVVPTARSMVFAALDHLIQRSDTCLSGIYFLAYDQREKSALDEALDTASLTAIPGTASQWLLAGHVPGSDPEDRR